MHLFTKAQVTRPWHHQEEDKEAHPCYDETWHREGQTPVVLHGKGKDFREVIFLPIYVNSESIVFPPSAFVFLPPGRMLQL